MVSKTREKLVDDFLNAFGQLRKKIIKPTGDNEIDNILGYFKHYNNGGNSYNAIIANSEQVKNEIPQYCSSMFESQHIPQGFDKTILAMYARGSGVHDIHEWLMNCYKVNIPEDTIGQVIAGVIKEVRIWQSRPLNNIYPIFFLCSIPVKNREEQRIVNRSVCLAIGITMEGQKELLGIWITNSDYGKFSRVIVKELKNRGVKDILIACVDDLKGFQNAVKSIFPQTQIQLCAVHLISKSLEYVHWKDSNGVRKDLKAIYTSATKPEARSALNAFCSKWDSKYPIISQVWRKKWRHIESFFDYPEAIRKALHAANAIDLFKRSLRKVINTKGVFSDDESVLTIFYLTSANTVKKKVILKSQWKAAMGQFAVLFANRFKL